jgi:TonB family protein
MTKLLLIAVLIFPFVTHPPPILRPSVQNSTVGDWQRMALRDEEFSVLVPTQPSALVQPEGYWFSDGGEKVLSHRAYSGYADGFVFVIESYRASRPQKLLKDVNRLFRNFGRVQMEPSGEANFIGFNATKYTIGRNNFTGNVYVLAGREHVYVVTVAAKTTSHPSFNRFLSSFALGQNAVTGTVAPKVQDDSVVPTPAAGGLVPSKETSPKAIVVWKPEPTYTEAARLNQRTGTVVLKGTFTSTGDVIITDVIKSLRDGLTEKAIAAAKNIEFFPAEKDGQLVSVSLQLEYNFNLY